MLVIYSDMLFVLTTFLGKIMKEKPRIHKRLENFLESEKKRMMTKTKKIIMLKDHNISHFGT